jgi:phage tail-like protein
MPHQIGTRVDPYGNFNFLIEIAGIGRAAFSEVTGFDSTVAVTEHREGDVLMKLAGYATFSNIVLKWGTTFDTELHDWYQRIVDGVMDRKGGAIVAYDRAGHAVARWEFVNAWPCKYDAPDFKAEGNDVAIESIELAHEGVARVKLGAGVS